MNLSRISLLFSCYFFLSLSVLSQSLSSSSVLSGSVVDTSGAAVPDVRVSVDNSSTGAGTRTGQDGVFHLPVVQTGILKLTLAKDGFESKSVEIDSALLSEHPLRIEIRVSNVRSSVVVTGTKEQVEMEKSPIAVNAVSRNDFEIRNVRLPDQTLNYEEGVNVFRSKGANDTGAGVGMRGFSGRTQARVLILLDGQPLNDAYTGSVSWGAIPISEVERVEVSRGPSSSLYGGNAMGGVIQLFTRPVAERSAEVSAQYGTYGTMMYSARYSDRLWNRLGFTLSYQRMQSDGYSVSGIYTTASPVTSAAGPLVAAPPYLLTTTGTGRYAIGNQGNNWYNQHAVRGRADYTFSERTTATFQFIQLRYQYGYNASVSTVFDSSGNPIISGSFYFNDGGLKRITISPTLFVAGPGGAIQNLYTGSLLHTFNARSWIRVAGGSTNSSDNWYSLPSGSATFSGGPGTTSNSPNRSSHGEVQWNWTQSAAHHFVFGAEGRQEKSTSLNYNLSDFANRDSTILLTQTSEGLDLTSAAYAQDDISLGHGVNLIAGGRYDYWRVYAGTAMSGPGVPLAAYPCRSAHAINGKVALAWQAPGKLTVRASVGNAFRPPTLINLYRSTSYPPGTITLPNPNLDPEHMTSWELGLRRRFGSVTDADATYFENYTKNLIYTTTDLITDPTGNTRTNLNAGRARTRGVEFAMHQHPLRWLQLSETYTLNDARITRNDYISLSVGRYVPYVPRNAATFSIIGDRKRWTGCVSGRYVSRTFNSDTNNDVVKGVPGAWDPYFELEATAGYRLNRWATFFISGDNLLDRQYYEYYLSPGRAISGGVRIRWQERQ